MKFTVILALVAAATVVSAETNAARLARGLNPNSPVKRGSPVLQARHGKPSGTPGKGQCNNGSIHCCDSVEKTKKNSSLNSLLSTLNIPIPSDGTSVGLNCSPMTGLGAGSGAKCSQQSVCCTGNSYNGLVNMGCSPMNIGL